METTYRVQGMTCNGCARSVTGAIQRVAPGVRVEISLDDKTAKVSGEHNEEAVKQAVEDAGFDFAGRVTG